MRRKGALKEETAGERCAHCAYSQELRITHPQLSEELQLVNMEMRVGKTRLEAMRELARRTGVEDIKTLVAMLIQTERFGRSDERVCVGRGFPLRRDLLNHSRSTDWQYDSRV
jgi:hypothetical protein